MNVQVQFATGQENRMSEAFGPYEYIEATYNALYSPDRQREIAYLNANGLWQTEDGQTWSDFTIVATKD